VLFDEILQTLMRQHQDFRVSRGKGQRHLLDAVLSHIIVNNNDGIRINAAHPCNGDLSVDQTVVNAKMLNHFFTLSLKYPLNSFGGGEGIFSATNNCTKY
jgi:hypothetical protein